MGSAWDLHTVRVYDMTHWHQPLSGLSLWQIDGLFNKSQWSECWLGSVARSSGNRLVIHPRLTENDFLSENYLLVNRGKLPSFEWVFVFIIPPSQYREDGSISGLSSTCFISANNEWCRAVIRFNFDLTPDTFSEKLCGVSVCHHFQGNFSA